MSVPTIYLDTNILVYPFENNDERARKLPRLFELSRGAGAPFLAVSEIALAELMVDPLRKGNERLILIYDSICVGNAFVRVGSVSREVLWLAAQVRAQVQSLRLPDAIHLSTAMLFECTRFLSADARLSDRYTVRPAPMIPYAQTGELVVIRPDLPTLDSIIDEAAL